MAYSKIRQPKLSDVIEQQLEFLILEGTLRPGEKLPPERELAKQFDVSRPSLREAIQRLEAKGLLLRRQGGGTFVQSSLWQSFSDPLVELLSDHPESQFDLLETRHALEGIAAYYAALRSTDEDKDRIRELHHAIELAQESGDLDAESEAVLQYQIAVTEWAATWRPSSLPPRSMMSVSTISSVRATNRMAATWCTSRATSLRASTLARSWKVV